MRIDRFFVFASLFLFTLLCSPSYGEPEYISIWNDNIKSLSRHISWAGDICAYSKGDPSGDILWVCFKSEHLFMGVDRGEGIIFRAWPIATGRNRGQKARVGDMRTPEGSFSIEKIHNASYWQPYVDGKTGDKIGYGPWFIRLKTSPWTGIGIHGTDKEHAYEIGTDASHGCIRMHNEDLKSFKKLAVPGQKVIIVP